MSKWCDSAEHHLAREHSRTTDEQDILSQIRQIEYLISKSRDIKIRGRLDFEEDFDEIKAGVFNAFWLESSDVKEKLKDYNFCA